MAPRTPHPRHAPAAGFTLVELIVVLAIIGSLLTLAVPRYFSALDQGRLAVQAANRHSLRDAIDKHHADHGRYPDTLDDLVQRRYLRELPVDPVSGRADWRLVPPPAGQAGRVYDVLPMPVADNAGTGQGDVPADETTGPAPDAAADFRNAPPAR